MLLILFLCLLPAVLGHGGLLRPCSQNAKFVECMADVPADRARNYDWHGLNCGGVTHSYPNYPSKTPLLCGVCGDPPEGPHLQEPGGAYFDDRIVETYAKGAAVDLTVMITASHLGNFWYDICNLDQESLTDACFKGPLQQTNGAGPNFTITSYASEHYNQKYTLPADLTCERCVLRWHWLAANNPPSGGLPNEYYRNCAFVRIRASGSTLSEQVVSGNSTTPTTSTPTTAC